MKTDDEHATEAAAYFEALDYAFAKFGASDPPAELPRARVHRRSWWRRVLALVAIVCAAGCAVDEPEPQRFTCVVVYRCSGEPELRAALAMPCATSIDDANERAAAAGIEAAGERCSTPWQSVRPICELYEPAESCEVAP